MIIKIKIQNRKRNNQTRAEQVKWDCRWTFFPRIGSSSRPSFYGPWPNQIILSCEVGGKTITKKFSVNAIINRRYSYLGCKAHCPVDEGIHAVCGGPNQYRIVEVDPSVLTDGRPVARLGDATEHNGGKGKIIQGAPLATENHARNSF